MTVPAITFATGTKVAAQSVGAVGKYVTGSVFALVVIGHIATLAPVSIVTMALTIQTSAVFTITACRITTIIWNEKEKIVLKSAFQFSFIDLKPKKKTKYNRVECTTIFGKRKTLLARRFRFRSPTPTLFFSFVHGFKIWFENNASLKSILFSRKRVEKLSGSLDIIEYNSVVTVAFFVTYYPEGNKG